MGSPVWALAGVGQDSAGKVAQGSSLESSGSEFRFLKLPRFMTFKFPFPYISLDMINKAAIFLI